MISQFVDNYFNQLADVVLNLPRRAIEDVIQVLLQAYEAEATIFVLGNGGSAATASHMANDLSKLTAVLPKRFKVIAFTDNVPILTAWGNDNGYANVFVEPMLNFLKAGDVVIGISTSGNSPNVVKALQVAQEVGATTILFGGRDGGKCAPFTDFSVLTPTTHQGMQEDCHLIFNHVIANGIRASLLEKVA